MSLSLAVLVALAIAVVLVLATRRPGITGLDARRLVDAGARLVDVRSPAEYARGHLQGAENLPFADLAARMAELGPVSQPLVVYCASGHRSGRAVRILQRRGFAAVHDLGPMGRWPDPVRTPAEQEPDLVEPDDPDLRA